MQLANGSSVDPSGRRWWLGPTLLMLLGFAFNVIPRPRSWSLMHIHKEDGKVFLHDFLQHGWASTFDRYSGYTHVVPRVLTGLGVTLLPLDLFAIWVGVTTALVKVGMFAVTYPIFRYWLANSSWSLAAASVFLFAPTGQQETLGNYTNLRWYLMAFAVVASFARFKSLAANILLLLAITAAVLTEPLTIVAVPVMIFSVIHARDWSRLLPAVGLGVIAANLFLILEPSDRGNVAGPFYFVVHPVEGLQQLSIRGFAGSEFGLNLSMAAMQRVGIYYGLVGLAVIALLLVVSWGDRSRQSIFGWALIAIAVGALLLTMGFSTPQALSLDEWYAIGHPIRYTTAFSLLFIPGMFSIFSSCTGRRRRFSTANRVISIALLAGLLLALLADFRGDQSKAEGPRWRDSLSTARTECREAGVRSARLEFNPQNAGVDWSSTAPCSSLG